MNYCVASTLRTCSPPPKHHPTHSLLRCAFDSINDYGDWSFSLTAYGPRLKEKSCWRSLVSRRVAIPTVSTTGLCRSPCRVPAEYKQAPAPVLLCFIILIIEGDFCSAHLPLKEVQHYETHTYTPGGLGGGGGAERFARTPWTHHWDSGTNTHTHSRGGSAERFAITPWTHTPSPPPPPHTHTHTQSLTHSHSHIVSDRYAVKTTVQMSLDGSFERERRIREAERLRQTVPNYGQAWEIDLLNKWDRLNFCMKTTSFLCSTVSYHHRCCPDRKSSSLDMHFYSGSACRSESGEISAKQNNSFNRFSQVLENHQLESEGFCVACSFGTSEIWACNFAPTPPPSLSFSRWKRGGGGGGGGERRCEPGGCRRAET